MGSCGQPLPGVIVALLDEDDQEVPTGEIGEICVRGRIVSDGYWKQPEMTAELLRNDWLHTGDMARQDETGYVYIVDRKKDMIITGGFNVFPREIEDVLAAHAGVSASVAIGVPDERWGEAVKAVVVLKPGAQPDADELIALVREKKGVAYAPKTIEFVADLPVTAIGKPDRKAVRGRFWQGQERQVH
jgi:fatty-acyl-CoA synthase